MRNLTSIVEGFFQNSGSGMEAVKTKYKNILEKYKIRNYTISDSGEVTIAHNIYLEGDDLDDFFEIDIKHVKGSFELMNKGKYLKITHFPKRISGECIIDSESWNQEDLGFLGGCEFDSSVEIYCWNGMKNLTGLPKKFKGSCLTIERAGNCEKLTGLPKECDYIFRLNCYSGNGLSTKNRIIDDLSFIPKTKGKVTISLGSIFKLKSFKGIPSGIDNVRISFKTPDLSHIPTDYDNLPKIKKSLAILVNQNHLNSIRDNRETIEKATTCVGNRLTISENV